MPTLFTGKFFYSSPKPPSAAQSEAEGQRSPSLSILELLDTAFPRAQPSVQSATFGSATNQKTSFRRYRRLLFYHAINSSVFNLQTLNRESEEIMFRPFKWISATAVLMCFSFAQAEYLLMTEALKYNIKKEFHACNPQLKMDILTYIEVDSITSIVFQAFKDKPEFWNLRFGHQWLDSRKIVPYLKDHPEILAEMDKVVAHRFNPNGCNWNIDSFANPLTQKQLDDTRKLASNLVKLYQKKLDFKYSEEELKKILPEVYTFLTFTQPVIYMKASELLRYVVADHYFGSMKTNPSDTMFAQTLTRIMGDKYTDEQFVKNYQSIINATKSWVESLEDVLGFILLIFTAPLC